MGLDVYVGTLTRYMTGDWETVVQRWARETGQNLRVHRTQPEPDDAITDPAVVFDVVEMWRTSLGAQLEQMLDWDETSDAPYFTDKPDWDSYGSVQALAARVELGEETRPEERVEDWSSDDAWQRASNNQQTRYAHLYMPELWFPVEIPVIQVEAPWGQELLVGSSQRLLDVLTEVNAKTYRVAPDERRTLAPSTGSFTDAARFGLAILPALAQLSVEHRLPLKLDY